MNSKGQPATEYLIILAVIIIIAVIVVGVMGSFPLSSKQFNEQQSADYYCKNIGYDFARNVKLVKSTYKILCESYSEHLQEYNVSETTLMELNITKQLYLIKLNITQ